jgi:hypothetical protein
MAAAAATKLKNLVGCISTINDPILMKFGTQTNIDM